MGNDEKAVLYPRYCFHLSPTWPVWCFFQAAEIHALKKHKGFEGEQFYFYRNLPIKWVRIVGIVVAIDDLAGRRVFTVDDSSGACIEAHETLVSSPESENIAHQEHCAGAAASAVPLPPPPPANKTSAYPDIDVGHIVEIKGGLSDFRDEMQINVVKLSLVRSTMEEVALWEKRTKFREDVLKTPWVLGSRELRKARKEAELDEAKVVTKRPRPAEGEHPKTTRYGGSTAVIPAHPQKQPLVQQPVNLRELLRDSKGKFGALGL